MMRTGKYGVMLISSSASLKIILVNALTVKEVFFTLCVSTSESKSVTGRTAGL